MGAVSQNLVFAGSILGAVCASQLPEFAQQYRQRIGGAVEELTRTVEGFDRDASASGLSRQQALERHDRASDTLFRTRGQSARRSIERLDRLSRQRGDFVESPPLLQPLVLTRGDGELLEGTWREFQPAVPVTLAGLGWGLLGFVFTSLMLFATGRMGRASWRSARHFRARRRNTVDETAS
ncbi:DUF2937 family protein [Aquibium sp. LZ166]|uniref:DUF2937 family protein n=1 Tax=Aquibium pacificus TaxID=3153579 RepID=A0ABV3SQY1_9HYPH